MRGIRIGVVGAIAGALALALPTRSTAQTVDALRLYLLPDAFPDRIGDFQRDDHANNGGTDAIARYRRGLDWADVYLYATPSTKEGDASRPITMHEEVRAWKAMLPRLIGFEFIDVIAVGEDVRLEEQVGDETVHGLVAGASVRNEQGPAATFYVLYELYDSRLMVRLTSSCADVEPVKTFAAVVLRSVLEARASHPSVK